MMLNCGLSSSSDNYEHEDYLHDNAVRLVLPLRYGVDISIHGSRSPESLRPGSLSCFTLLPVSLFCLTISV
jgi:hypothetical protein